MTNAFIEPMTARLNDSDVSLTILRALCEIGYQNAVDLTEEVPVGTATIHRHLDYLVEAGLVGRISYRYDYDRFFATSEGRKRIREIDARLLPAEAPGAGFWIRAALAFGFIAFLAIAFSSCR